MAQNKAAYNDLPAAWAAHAPSSSCWLCARNRLEGYNKLDREDNGYYNPGAASSATQSAHTMDLSHPLRRPTWAHIQTDHKPPTGRKPCRAFPPTHTTTTTELITTFGSVPPTGYAPFCVDSAPIFPFVKPIPYFLWNRF